MRVIFIKDLKNQGKKGQIKEVADGYGINFLIAKGFAVQETVTNLSILKKDTLKEANIKEQEMAEANKLKAKLEKETFTFIVKTGSQDKVFGSISSKQIHEELDKKGYQIDKKKIILKDPLQSLGNHIVEVELYKNIHANLNVALISRWEYGRKNNAS